MDAARVRRGASIQLDRDALRMQVEKRLAAHIMSPNESRILTRRSRSEKLQREPLCRAPQKSHRRTNSKPKLSSPPVKDSKWEKLCQRLCDEVESTPAPPFQDNSHEVLQAIPRLKKSALYEDNAVAPPGRFGWVEVEDRWYRDSLEEWLFKPDDGAFFHAASGMLWVELPAWGLVRADVAQRRSNLHSAMLSLLGRSGTHGALRMIFQSWRRFCFGSDEVARAYGVSPSSAESPQLQLPSSTQGIRPTTSHVYRRGVDRPPLEAAWIESRDCPGWFCSRVSASWVFKASERILYHVPSESLWKVDEANNFESCVLRNNSESCALRRIDENRRAALLRLAEASTEAIKQICLASWREVVVRMCSKDEARWSAMEKCMACMEYFLMPCSTRFGAEFGAMRFENCCHVLCIECLGAYALSAVDLHQWTYTGLPCPSPTCETYLTGENALRIASLTSRQRESIATHLCQILIEQPVHCPNPICGAVYESLGSASCPMVTCQECQVVFCCQCRCLWHVGKTCQEHRLCPDAEDASLLIFAKLAGWQRCSHCGSMIERVEGCNHVTCVQCGYHFCYRCGGVFDRKRYICVTRGCDIHRPLLREVAYRELQVAGQTAQQLHRWFWSETGALDDERRSYLSEWALSNRCNGVAHAAMISLARRGPYGLMPLWQRRAVWENRCPYCQQLGSSSHALAAHLGTMCRQQVLACCERLFYDLDELDVHVRERHRQ